MSYGNERGDGWMGGRRKSPEEERAEIIAACKPLLDLARKEGKWLMWAGDTEVIFSPRELEEEWKHGRFVHGPSNWRLVSPHGMLSGIIDQINDLTHSLSKLRARIDKERELANEPAGLLPERK